MGPSLAIAPVYIAGNEEQKKKYLGMLAAEPLIASYCVTGTRRRIGCSRFSEDPILFAGDEYVINGNKAWITSGGHAQWFFVLARTDSDPKTPAGKAFTAFIVDGDTPGIIRGKKEKNLGQRCADTRTITSEDVAMGAFDMTRPGCCSRSFGTCLEPLDESAKYSLERKTFGTQIANHQAVQFMLADMAINLEMARLVTYKAATDVDNRVRSSYYASIAKCFAADIWLIKQPLMPTRSLAGGAAFNTEYPVEGLPGCQKSYQIYEGNIAIQRMVISRMMFGHLASTGTCRV
ncbi:unnamed protein product, partial [Mesorhabditis spiculigera]